MGTVTKCEGQFYVGVDEHITARVEPAVTLIRHTRCDECAEVPETPSITWLAFHWGVTMEVVDLVLVPVVNGAGWKGLRPK